MHLFCTQLGSFCSGRRWTFLLIFKVTASDPDPSVSPLVSWKAASWSHSSWSCCFFMPSPVLALEQSPFPRTCGVHSSWNTTYLGPHSAIALYRHSFNALIHGDLRLAAAGGGNNLVPKDRLCAEKIRGEHWWDWASLRRLLLACHSCHLRWQSQKSLSKPAWFYKWASLAVQHRHVGHDILRSLISLLPLRNRFCRQA